jgi:hypothetical protein
MQPAQPASFLVPACHRSATRMKAEQRKELETNALADRMGHLVQRMKTQPRRATLYYVVGAVAIVIVLIVLIRWYQVDRLERAQQWILFGSSVDQNLIHLAQKFPETNPGKAARFQIAWMFYWETGVKRLGVGNGTEGMESLKRAAGLYKGLADECAGDKLWEPEAMYGLAVIEETRAIMNIDYLDRAKKMYEDLKAKYPDSARGKLAADWLTDYEKKEKRDELQQFYQEMHTSLNIIDLDALRKQLEQKKDLFPPLKDGKQTK